MLTMSVFGGAAALVTRSIPAWARGAEDAKMVSIVQFTDAGVRGEVVQVAKLVKSESEWRRQLTPVSFEVTRQSRAGGATRILVTSSTMARGRRVCATV